MLTLTLFGNFSVQASSTVLSEDTLRAPRLYRAITYLFANRDKRIPLREFSAFLREGKHYAATASYSAGSDSLVKTTLHRVRAALKPLQDEDEACRLITVDGALRFDPMLVFTSDAEKFDELYDELKNTSASLAACDTDRALFCFRSLFALYQGRYLATLSDEDFVMAQAKRYHERYLLLCEEYFPILFEIEAFDEVIDMANRGIAIDPYFEPFHYWKIRSLAEKGEKALALALYDSVERLFDHSFHVKPSAKMRALKELLCAAPLAQNAKEALATLATSPSACLTQEAFSALLRFSGQVGCQKTLSFALIGFSHADVAPAVETKLHEILAEKGFFCRLNQTQYALLFETHQEELQHALTNESLFTLLEVRSLSELSF